MIAQMTVIRIWTIEAGRWQKHMIFLVFRLGSPIIEISSPRKSSFCQMTSTLQHKSELFHPLYVQNKKSTTKKLVKSWWAHFLSFGQLAGNFCKVWQVLKGKGWSRQPTKYHKNCKKFSILAARQQKWQMANEVNYEKGWNLRAKQVHFLRYRICGFISDDHQILNTSLMKAL